MFIGDVISNPDYILEDSKNKDTLLFLKTISCASINIQIVVRLNTSNSNKNMCNSILTFWKIKKKTYERTIRNR